MMGKMYIGTADGMKELKTGKEEVHGEQIFTSSGTFTVPEGVTHIDVFLVGGGASGGTSTSPGSTSVSVYCGGGGFTRTLTHLPVEPGSKHTVVVGKGGPTPSRNGENVTGGNAIAVSGTAGGASYFDGYICKGGFPINYNSSNVVVGGKSGLSAEYYFINAGSDHPAGSQTGWNNIGIPQDDSTNAFGLLTETEYCIKRGSTPGSGGEGYARNYCGYGTAGKDGICIIRW